MPRCHAEDDGNFLAMSSCQQLDNSIFVYLCLLLCSSFCAFTFPIFHFPFPPVNVVQSNKRECEWRKATEDRRQETADGRQATGDRRGADTYPRWVLGKNSQGFEGFKLPLLGLGWVVLVAYNMLNVNLNGKLLNLGYISGIPWTEIREIIFIRGLRKYLH